ncbi:retrovirus-related Pol polyprotein from transposon 297 [Trichonephila clavipes]|nr:retrovirus-related Pol polyprotein from transposon 297 [Trichonephila clavipes]
MAGGDLRLLHVKKIREYRARVQTVGVIYDDDDDDEFGEIYETPTVPAAEKNDEALDRVTLDYLSKKQQTQLKDLLHRHRTLFSGKIKRAKVAEHVIKLKNEEETMKPKTNKIPENLKGKVELQIDELLELGLIEPVKLECPYRTGRISNAEYDGVEFLSREEKIHYCTRYVLRILVYTNGRQHQKSNSLPNSSRAVPMECVTIGLRNAAATYQRAMSKVVQTISDFACAYINDLAIFSDTWEEHLNHLEVFKRLEHFNFSVNLGKQYIPNFGKIALPLTGLTKKKVPNEIPWSKELKTSLCGITELQVPDIEKPYYLHTDASQTAVGCCLGQLDGKDNIHPIAFGSQKLNPSQQRWSAIEREAYAIIWALKRFETLLCGTKTFLLTDHNPLVFLTSDAPQWQKLQRWALAIQRHDIEASHMKRSKLVNADALSRL